LKLERYPLVSVLNLTYKRFFNIHHLDDAATALSIKLTAEEIASLEEPYIPHPVLGGIS
jgi:hypothetical protein